MKAKDYKRDGLGARVSYKTVPRFASVINAGPHWFIKITSLSSRVQQKVYSDLVR